MSDNIKINDRDNCPDCGRKLRSSGLVRDGKIVSSGQHCICGWTSRSDGFR